MKGEGEGLLDVCSLLVDLIMNGFHNYNRSFLGTIIDYTLALNYLGLGNYRCKNKPLSMFTV